MRSVALSSLVSLVSLAPLAGCSSASPSPAPFPADCDAVFAASDYSSSCVGGFAFDGGGAQLCGVDLGNDPALATSKGRAFYIDRYSGSIFELDPVCGRPLGTKVSANGGSDAGIGANPQDVAVASNASLWVPRYDIPSVLVIAPDGTEAASIDLSSYDTDGNPEASAIDIVSVGGAEKAFVTLEKLVYDAVLERPKPQPGVPSQVLRLDTSSLKVEAAITLVGQNPFAVDRADDGAMWLAEPGDFYTLSEPLAGVERFDPQSSTSRMVAREADLGGSASEVAVLTASDCAAAIVADASSVNRTSLVTFVPSTGVVLAPASKPVLGPTAGFDLEGVLWVGNVLLLGDRRAAADGRYAVHAFDLGPGCALTERSDAIFLPQAPIGMRRSVSSR